MPPVDADGAFGPTDFSKRRSVIIAVSGGSDSLALLHLIRPWLSEKYPELWPVAVTIDHGLRDDSASEAAAVALLCRDWGIKHRTVGWHGAKPATGRQAGAREARYRLLSQAAAEEGTDLVLTGHTADDQAETVAMRARRGKGAGLAGMARHTLYGGRCWIVRPLLDVRRSVLRDMLRESGVAWFDDPSNAVLDYERVRVRGSLADGDVADLLAKARAAAAARVERSRQAAAFIDRYGKRQADGVVRLSSPPATDDPADPAFHALRTILACCGERAFLPGVDETAALLNRLEDGRATLARTLVIKRDEVLCFTREQRGDAGAELDGKTAEYSGFLAPFDHFLPDFDLTLADAAARLFGRTPYPPPPVPENSGAAF